MATNVYSTVKNCIQCPEMGTKFRNERQLERFPSAGPLGFVAIDIPDPLPKIKIENQFVVIKTDN